MWRAVIPPVPPSAATVASRQLGERIVAHAGRLSASTCQWLLMVAAFDAGDGCAAFGLPTTAAWLSYSCGLSKRTAVEHVRVARYLAAFPALVQEMSGGRLSYSQVRAITRALTLPPPAQPANAPMSNAPMSNAPTVEPADTAETDPVPAPLPMASPLPTADLTPVNPATDYTSGLIGVARNGTVAQLESVVRGLRTVATNEASMAGAPLPERVGLGWNQDGTWRLSARLSPERGAVVEAALTRVGEAEGLNREDALIRLAEIALAHLNDADLRALNSDERAAVIIQIDADRIPQPRIPQPQPSLADGRRSAERDLPPAARILDGPGLPDDVALRLLCDGRIRTAVTHRDSTERLRILDVGRSHRLATKRQRRALVMRQGGRCGHPGCTNRHGLEAHHVIHWLHGGPTDLDNLILLCPNHHQRHHEGSFSITAEPGGRFDFTLADGTPLPDTVDPGRLIAGAPPVESEHPGVGAAAATTGWLGDRLDRRWAVSVLAQQRPPAA